MRLVLVGLLLLVNAVHGQVNVDNAGANANPSILVPDVLTGGGVSTSGTAFVGNVFNQIGYFTDSSSSIGLSSGVILCTGNSNLAENPNSSTSTTDPVGGFGTSTDPDLLALSNSSPLFDPVILEFDVLSNGDELFIDFVFASEEYNEFVCSNLADVMGIFISGPGINGPYENDAENIAT